MKGRNPLLELDDPGYSSSNERKHSDFHERLPISPQTLNPLNNFPSLNTLSQLKSAKLQSSKLDYFIEPEDELGPRSQVVTLFSSADGSVHCHDEAVSVLQRYSSNDIAFIGIWGAEDSDKSFFYDRILELCDVREPKYTDISIASDSSNLVFFYERPFVKGNIRIFLLDCRGYKDADHLTRQQKMQLDILMALCEIVVLAEKSYQPAANVKPKDIVESGYEHFNDSFKRLYLQKGLKDLHIDEISWPVSLLILFDSSKSIKVHQNTNSYEQQLERMFQDYNFSVLHNKNVCSEKEVKSYTTINNPLDELYSKNASTVFRDMYEKIHRKAYLGLKFTGSTVPHIVSQLSYAMNKHQTISFPKTYDKARRSTYASLYNRQALAYLIKMKEYVGEEKAYSTSYLLNAFDKCKSEVFEEYDDSHEQISVGNKNQELFENYEQKLQAYVEEKQKNVLSVNFKKSMKELSAVRTPIVDSNKVDIAEEFGKLTSHQKEVRKKFDSNADAHTAGNVLKTLYRMKSEPIDHIDEMEIEEMRASIFKKKQLLNSVYQSRQVQVRGQQDNQQMQQREVQQLMKKSKYFSQQIAKTNLSIKNLRRRKQEVSVTSSNKELDRLIGETKFQLSSLEQRLTNKQESLQIQKKQCAVKSEQQALKERRLQETIEQISKIKTIIMNSSQRKGIRMAEVRRLEGEKAIRRPHRQ